VRGSSERENTVVRCEAQALLFGFPPAIVKVQIRARALGWRTARAAQILGLFLLITPIAALVPPHAPWGIGALITGVLLARKRWSERFTLEQVAGCCPKCSEELNVKPGRLKHPHPLSCDTCHHQSSLEVARVFLEQTQP
jgi:hypothetical protein